MTLYTYKLLFPSSPFGVEWKVTIAKKDLSTAIKKARGEIKLRMPSVIISKHDYSVEHELIEVREVNL